MKIVVTGGAGFIGSHIVDLLIQNHYEVHIIDNLSSGKMENLNSNAIFHKADIRDVSQMDLIFSEIRPKHVIHHAAQVSVHKSSIDPLLDSQINIEGTINILTHCVKYQVEKIVYASSAAVYGIPSYLSIDEKHPAKPISCYGISKYTPETYIKLFSDNYDLKYTILRYANVFGERQDPHGEGGVVSIFLDSLLHKKIPSIYGDGEQTRDFIYVKDVAQANLLALTNADNLVLNIGTQKEVSVNQLYEIVSELAGLPEEPKYLAARLGDIPRSCLNSEAAQYALKWVPKFSLQSALTNTWDYYSLQSKE